MLQIRNRSKPSSARQSRQMVEITTSGENLPLPGNNWTNRWCTLAQDFGNRYEEIYNFEVRSDDVFVVTFPKCGTTWVQEAAWLLKNNLNFNEAKSNDLANRSVFMDLSAIYNIIQKNTIELAKNLKSPRLIKSHMPAYLLPRQIWEKKTKIIYCARNPYDVAVSYCHFHRGIGGWSGSMDEFVEDFVNAEIMYTPYWPSVLDFWQMRHEPNVLFITYEEMQRNLAGVLTRMCTFLERPALTESEMQKMLEHLSFENMKGNNRVNPTESIKSKQGRTTVSPEFQFMRRGIVGAYKDELTEENRKCLDQWTEKSLEGYNVTVEDIFGTL